MGLKTRATFDKPSSGETLTRMVQIYLTPLFLDGSGIFVFPFPDFLEFFTTEVITGMPLRKRSSTLA